LPDRQIDPSINKIKVTHFEDDSLGLDEYEDDILSLG
jgi:hypothetical protein